jgi:CBS domain-containing protein
MISDLNLSMQRYKEIKETDTINRALPLFTEPTDILMVMNVNNNYSGALTEHIILHNLIDPEKAKVKQFKIDVPKVKTTTEISECARLMVENNIMQLPVFDKEKVSGIISYIDIFHLPFFKKLWRNPVKDIIIQPEVTITLNEKISIVINKFKQHGLFSIPVVENEQLIGMVSLHELINTIIGFKGKPEHGTAVGEKIHLLDMPVKNIMTKVSITASNQATISEVIEKMLENRLDSLPIIENDNLQGIITIKDLLKLVTSFDDLIFLPKIQINSDIVDLDRDLIQTAVIEFAEQFSSILGECSFDVYVRAHREKQKHKKLIFTRIHIFAHKHKFEATAEAWGEALSLKEALEKLERQVIKEKPTKKHLRDRN